MEFASSHKKYEKIPDCPHYHPSSELSSQPGFYPNISNDQLLAANELIYLIESGKLNFNSGDEVEFLKLLRFLRARKFHVKNAFKMVENDIKWRAEENRENLRNEMVDEVLGCNVTDFYKYFPAWIQGHDKQMRPVSYRQFGHFEIWNVLKLTSLQKLIRFHSWEAEQALRVMNNTSKDTGYNIETFVLVIDAAGWSMKLATSDAFAFIKGMVSTDADHYPERLGVLFVINAPSMLSFAWRIIQGFLDKVTKEKIHILSSDPVEWKPVLLKYIDEDQIPQMYGGTAMNLTAEDALLSMNPPQLQPQKVEQEEMVHVDSKMEVNTCSSEEERDDRNTA